MRRMPGRKRKARVAPPRPARRLADAIAYAGYDTCSLASNHSLDSGTRGVVGTVEALDRVGVPHTGLARSPEQRARLNLLEVNGATVAHLAYGLGNFLSNQSPRWGARKPGTQDGVILRLTVTEDPAASSWPVTSISHTPTRVNRATFEIVEALYPRGRHNPAEMALSASDTARALGALGTEVRAVPGLSPHPAEWLSDLLGG